MSVTGGEYEREAPNLDDCVIRIHLHKEADYYVAHCLELDLVATDPKPWRAVETVALLINRQINFGLSVVTIKDGNEAHIWFPAPHKYFDAAAQRDQEHARRVEQLIGDRKAVTQDYADEKHKREAAESALSALRQAAKVLSDNCAFTTARPNDLAELRAVLEKLGPSGS